MLSFNVKKTTNWEFENEISRFSLYYYDEDPKTIYLSFLLVEEEYRWKGLGTAIMEYAENFAREKGFTTIMLKTDLLWMQRWYIKIGYDFLKAEGLFHWLKKDLSNVSNVSNITDKKDEPKTKQKFSKGDIIVWHDNSDKEKSVLCWMIISNFDYPSDRAARARVGKSYNQYSYKSSVIYGGWCPNNFGEDVRLANDEEVGSILIELSNYYQHEFKEGIGEEILKIDLLGFRDDLYEKILEMMK